MRSYHRRIPLVDPSTIGRGRRLLRSCWISDDYKHIEGVFAEDVFNAIIL